MKSDRKILYHTDGDYVPLEELERLEKELAEAKEVISEQQSIIDTIGQKFKQNTLSESLKQNTTIRSRFFKFIEVKESCHEWTGYISPQGYGSFSINDRPHLAHRVSAALNKAGFYDFHVVDHVCMNRKCVNPEHLRLVGTFENSVHNSNSRAATNYAKTHCKSGHPLSGDNLIFKAKKANGTVKQHRLCRICRDKWKENGKRARDFLGRVGK